MSPTTAVLWGVLIAALTGPPAPAQQRDWQVTMASLWGTSGDDQFNACAVTRDGVAIVGGSGFADVEGVPVHVIEKGPGVLLRIDTALGELLSVTRLSAPVTDVLVGPDGALYIAAAGLARLAPDGATQAWSIPVSGQRLHPDGEGGLWITSRGSCIRLGPDGKTLSTLDLKARDLVVDPKRKLVFVCGFTPGSSKKSGNPVHVPWVRAFDYSGKPVWKMWGFTPTEVDEVGDMADSHPQRLCYGPDGFLYMFGDSDGGNTAYRHSAQTPGGDIGDALKGTPFNEMWRAFRSVRMLFVCRINPADGTVVRGSFFYGKWYNDEAKREEIGDGEAKGLSVDAAGRVYLTGVLRCSPTWTANAVHKESAPVNKTGYWNNKVATDEMFLTIIEDNFSRLAFCSGFGQGNTGNYSCQGLAAAGNDVGAVVVGFAATPASGKTAPAHDSVYLARPLAAFYAGGKDAYVATLGSRRPPADPVQTVRLLTPRMFPAADANLVRAVGSAATFGPLLAKLDTMPDAPCPGVAAMIRRIGRETMNRAEWVRDSAPATCRDLLVRTAAGWQGTDIGAAASKRITELQGDPRFTAQLAVDEPRARIQALEDQLLPAPGARDSSWADTAYLARNGGTLRQMQGLLKGMVQQWPDKAPTREARRICSAYDIPLTKEDDELLKLLTKVQDQERGLVPVAGATRLYTDKRFLARNKQRLESMQGLIRQMIQTGRNHPYTQKARAIGDVLDIPGT